MTRARLLLALVLAPAQAPDLELVPPGAAVSEAGDADLDGSGDVVVGAWWIEAGEHHGAVTLFAGRSGKALHTLRGAEAEERYGFAVGGGGDTNADGAADFLIGAPGAARDGVRVGAVEVRSGRDGELLWHLFGAGEGERFGWSVENAGDLDQDGFAEVVVGAPLAADAKERSVGAARVFSGKDGSLLHEWSGAAAGDLFGASVDGAGDADADGSSDVVVGAPGGGYARLYSGRTGRLLREYGAPKANTRFAWRVAGAGDVNQSGSSAVVVAVPWDEQVGALVFGASKSKAMLALERGARAKKAKEVDDAWGFGLAVDGAGDVDADGFADLIVGDPGHPRRLGASKAGLPSFLRDAKEVARPGRALVLSGHDGELLLRLEGEAEDDGFGLAVSGAGDVDQDGFDDVIVGAARGAQHEAWVVSGKDGERLHALDVPRE